MIEGWVTDSIAASQSLVPSRSGSGGWGNLPDKILECPYKIVQRVIPWLLERFQFHLQSFSAKIG